MKFVVVLILCLMGLASNAVTIDDISACTVCHGTNLQGNRATDAPAIAGMQTWYVLAQLNSFRAGTRGKHAEDFSGMEMQPQALVITGDAVEKIAEFISKLPVQDNETSVTGNVTNGLTLYQSCAACHGLQGEGNPGLGAPSLTIQNDWYLEVQLNHYIKGIRGQTLGDQQMRASVGQLTSTEAVRDLISYINTLGN